MYTTTLKGVKQQTKDPIMKSYLTSEFSTPSEQLNTLANIVELALYAPAEEVTPAGRDALQRAARQIVVLSGEVVDAGANSDRC